MAKVLNSPIKEGRMKLKRFSPGIDIEDICPNPKCKEKTITGISFLYPSWGQNTIEMVCSFCSCVWNLDVEIFLSAKIVKSGKK